MSRITTTHVCRLLLPVLLCAFGAPLHGGTKQGQAETSDPWGPLRLLEGSWRGSTDGMLGTGSRIREHEFILRGNFLLSKHASVRLP